VIIEFRTSNAKADAPQARENKAFLPVQFSILYAKLSQLELHIPALDISKVIGYYLE
jgi:hypothetical protein